MELNEKCMRKSMRMFLLINLMFLLFKIYSKWALERIALFSEKLIQLIAPHSCYNDCKIYFVSINIIFFNNYRLVQPEIQFLENKSQLIIKI